MNERLLATVDAHRIRLFSADKTPDRGWWLSEITDQLDREWLVRIDAGRPTVTGTEQPAGRLSQHDDDRETNHRFGKEVVEMLGRAAEKRGAGRVDVFAAAKMFAQLRDGLEGGNGNGHANGRFHVHQNELMKLTPEKLAGHPAVKACLG